MANRFWVGNTGNWSDTTHWSATSGGVGGASLPTSVDDVYFDASSFTLVGQTVNTDTGVNFGSLDFTGVSMNPTFSYPSSNFNLAGNLILVSGMIWSGSGTIGFNATTTGKTITTAGKTIGSFQFSGSGGGWTFQDNVTLSGNLDLSMGNLDTGGKTISCSQFSSSGTNTRTLTLGASILNVSGDWIFTTVTGLTFNANTSTINMTGTSKTFNGGGLTYNYVGLQGTPTTIVGNNSFARLTVNTSKTVTLTAGSTQTFADVNFGNSVTFTASANANFVYNGSTMTGCGNGLTKTNITVTTPNAPANKRYWVGNTGYWYQSAHWSVFSGFFSGASEPTSADSVYFDANSFSLTGQTVSVLVASPMLNMDWTGATNTPTFVISGTLSIYGNVTLISAMNVTNDSGYAVRFEATTTGKTITTNGNSFLGDLQFFGVGGGWTLQDTLSIGVKGITHYAGTLNTNGQTLNIGFMQIMGIGTKVLNLGASTITCIDGWYVGTVTGLTFNANTSKIIITNDASTFTGAGLTYYDLELQGTPITIKGSNTFNKLTVLTSKTLTLTDSTTQTVMDLALGNSSIISATTSANIIMNGTTVTPLGTSVTKTNITVTTPNAPANKRYWVGGTGNINDTAHWSTLSGFFGGASVLTSTISAYFDANSFTGVSQVVTLNATTNCLDMDWTGATNSPILAGSSQLDWYGNVTLITAMTFSHTGNKYFNGVGKTLITAGKTFLTGTVRISNLTILGDSFTTTGIFQILGSLTTNGYNINCGDITFNNTPLTLSLSTSIITLSGSWNNNSSAMDSTTIVNSAYKIVMTGNTKAFAGGGLTYYDVELQGTPTTITGSNTFNDLKLTAAKTTKFTAGTTQTLTGDLTGDGTSGNLITIESVTAGSPFTISKASGTVDISYYSIKDSTVTGGATFNATDSTNVSGNTGWNWIYTWIAPNLKQKVGGLLTSYSDGWVKIDGVLKHIDSMWTKIDGVLKKL